MTLDGRKYLVCVDYFSNYTMVDRLQGISSCSVKLIRKHFMRYGIPEEFVSDGFGWFGCLGFMACQPL